MMRAPQAAHGGSMARATWNLKLCLTGSKPMRMPLARTLSKRAFSASCPKNFTFTFNRRVAAVQ